MELQDFKFSETIKVLDLKDRVPYSRKNVQLLNLDALTMKQYNSWFSKDGKYYYFKSRNFQEFMNHLLGKRIAKIMVCWLFILNPQHLEDRLDSLL